MSNASLYLSAESSTQSGFLFCIDEFRNPQMPCLNALLIQLGRRWTAESALLLTMWMMMDWLMLLILSILACPVSYQLNLFTTLMMGGWVVLNVNVWWSSTLAARFDLSATSLVSIRVRVPLESWVVHYLAKQYTRIVNKLEPDIYRRVDNDIIRSLVHVYHSGSEFIKALTR